MMRIIAAGTWLAVLTVAAPVFAQEAAAHPPAARYVSVIGTVASIDTGSKSLTFKTDKAETTTIKFDDRTQFLRLPAGETDMKKAIRAKSEAVSAGDRAIARLKTDERTGAPAVFLYFTRQTDLAQRQKKTDEEWATQSVNGTVKSVDAPGRKVLILVRGGFGPAKDVTLDANGPVEFLRFSLDSGKYEPGAAGLAGIQPGDQVRVLGQKNTDQSEIKLEAVMSGTFKSAPVQVRSVDTAAGTIFATDLVSKKPVTVNIKPDTLLKRLDDATALLMARRLNPSFQTEGGGGGGQPVGTLGAGAFGGGGGRGARNTDPNKVLNQQPSIQLADLKPGESVVVTGTPSTDTSKVTAVSVVAGVDPILRAAPQNGPDPLGGNWNFSEVSAPQ
ncbi:MAG: hypothetical protein M3N93_04845 [Acidobacteriota bacterium]|nr:hypothetical protein [Acidobacteriota bacterium]